VNHKGNYYCYVNSPVTCYSVSTNKVIAEKVFQALYPKCLSGNLVQQPLAFFEDPASTPVVTAPVVSAPVVEAENSVVSPKCVLKDNQYYCYVTKPVNCYSVSSNKSIAEKVFQVLYPRCLSGNLEQRPLAFFEDTESPPEVVVAPPPPPVIAPPVVIAAPVVTPTNPIPSPKCVLNGGQYYCYVTSPVTCYATSASKTIAEKVFQVLYPRCLSGNLEQQPLAFFDQGSSPSPVIVIAPPPEGNESAKIEYIKDHGPTSYAVINKKQLQQILSEGLVDQKRNMLIFKPKGCFSRLGHSLSQKSYFLIQGQSIASVKAWSQFCEYYKKEEYRMIGFRVNDLGVVNIEGRNVFPDYRHVNKDEDIFFTNTITDQNFLSEVPSLTKPRLRFKVLINENADRIRPLLFGTYLRIFNAEDKVLSNLDKSRLKVAIAEKLKIQLKSLEEEFFNRITISAVEDSVSFIKVPREGVVSKSELIGRPSIRASAEVGVVNMGFAMPVIKTTALSFNSGILAGFFTPNTNLLDLELLRHEVSHNMGAFHPRCKDSVHALDFACVQHQDTYKIRRADLIHDYQATDDMSIMDSRAISSWVGQKDTYLQTIYRNQPEKVEERILEEQEAYRIYETQYYKNIKNWEDYARTLEWYYNFVN